MCCIKQASNYAITDEYPRKRIKFSSVTMVTSSIQWRKYIKKKELKWKIKEFNSFEFRNHFPIFPHQF